ncbi:flagellar assembly protein FliW [Heyndrickxia shackletonii]|uniref:flagellar assembly protein FliW n=1 Tax=Heyndrickxia shackletonii TaxID=157838 RepID=UPI000B224148|nr:flagellar assembly protein FliW [Heyndrickxia shackletonii]
MKLQTKYHGEIEIKKDDILTFTNGLPGFPDEREFILLPLQENQLFSILQSLQTKEVAFVLTSPFEFFSEYEIQLDSQTLEQLEIKNDKDVTVMVILTVHDPFNQTTANLQAPIVTNIKNRQSKQLILNDSRYKTKHPIFTLQTENVKG